jgi:hypothetical protein
VIKGHKNEQFTRITVSIGKGSDPADAVRTPEALKGSTTHARIAIEAESTLKKYHRANDELR